MTIDETPMTLHVPEADGNVSALLLRPADARWLFVLGHGAGAGMRHIFMERLAAALAVSRVATLRYQFPYMERRSRRPDGRAVLLGTVRAAVEAAGEIDGELPLLAGGKSMGGRMTSHAASERPLPGVRGLCFVGFPLHPARRPGTARGDHLADVQLPMLFLQGTRDALAELDLVRPVCAGLGDRATLHIVDGADHGFAVLKRSGRNEDDVLAELVATVASWAERLTS